MKKLALIVPVILVLLTQFTNCSPYSTDTSELSSLGDLVCDTDCITPNAANLSIRPNLFEGSVFKVHAALGDFNIAGDCNEGGYAYNVITWDLLDAQNNKVRDSSMASAVSRCVNGRFSVYVTLAQIAGDNVNRTGLMVNGNVSTRQQYTLKLQVFGQPIQNGALQAGPDGSRTVILTGG